MLQIQAKNQVYDAVTDCIIDFLERGIIPWHTSFAKSGVPTNLITKRPYRGINALLLAAPEYKRNYFMTYSQINRLEICVLQGEHPHLVVERCSSKKIHPYYVYNIAQCSSIPKDLIPEQFPKKKPIEACRELIERLEHCPKLTQRPEQAFYNLEEDIINMPSMKCFKSHGEYMAWFLKMLISCTKYETRLDRTELAEFALFDPESFAIEEMICEVGAWNLRSLCGLQAAMPQYDDGYIPYWIEKLRHNSKLAFNACYQAQRAAEFVIGVTYDVLDDANYFEDEELPF